MRGGHHRGYPEHRGFVGPVPMRHLTTDILLTSLIVSSMAGNKYSVKSGSDTLELPVVNYSDGTSGFLLNGVYYVYDPITKQVKTLGS